MFLICGLILAFCVYMTLLFIVALNAEKKNSFLAKASANPICYALALGIYCTTWTYYGSVGKAATSGMTFLTVYIGPTLGIFFWCYALRKMIRIKHTYRITSIADFISARYNKSHFLAIAVTIIAMIGVIPYVALQLRAAFNTITILVSAAQIESLYNLKYYLSCFLVLLIMLFTIIFGARRLDPTEIHRGMMLSVAIQSLVQLMAFLCVGVFVTYFLFDGFSDIFKKLADSPHHALVQIGYHNPSDYMIWFTCIILGMSAVNFLPRQFHVAVVENSRESHLKTAIWGFPLYMLLITIFVIPIAAGGLLKNLPISQADSFVLRLPLNYNKPWLSIMVALGGLSAATSMIMISSMTITTMFTNHILLPFIETSKRFMSIRKHLLEARWIAIIIFILLACLFERLLGQSYMLVNIGLISFAAVLQFAPSMIGAIYWKKANRVGATMGLLSGFCVWFYTLLLPAIIKSGVGNLLFIRKGPFGIALLRPENLFGIKLPNNIVHSVFWSLSLNLFFYIGCSLITKSTPQEEKQAENFVDILSDRKKIKEREDATKEKTIALTKKIRIIHKVLDRYFSLSKSQKILDKCLENLRIKNREVISLMELFELQNELEKILTGSLGSATAHRAIIESNIFNSEESEQLAKSYTKILANLKLTPRELLSKIDYYKDREDLLKKHSQELKNTNKKLEERVEKRTELLQKTNKELKAKIREIEQTRIELQEAYLVLKNTQGQLLQSEKLAAIGQLAAGIAHEINNPAGFIKTNLSVLNKYNNDVLLIMSMNKEFAKAVNEKDTVRTMKIYREMNETERKLDMEHTLKDLTNIIRESEDGIERISKIVSDLKTFSSKDKGIMIRSDINKIIDNILNIVKNETKYKVSLVKKYKKIPLVKCNPQQIGQVFINILINAAHAIVDTGKITIKTYEEKSEKKVIIEISDTGEGMTQDTINRISEPFFTTKEVGKGSGLGLSIAYEIVKKHNGTIEVKSELDKGSTFKIKLPINS